ncbi:MAG: response regulator transcription factor [Bryobacteraceae bacterium]|jgi:DNA-binding NarL/FixJ family response regulator
MPTEHVPGDQKITSVALYSQQPILTAGLEAVVSDLEDCTLSGIFTALDPLIEHVQTRRPSVVLLDMTAIATFFTLSKLKSLVDIAPVVLWVDADPAEFASEALAIGVRGILRQSLPIELQIKCLRIVAAGHLWVEQTLCERLLTPRRVLLTPRERQVASLVAQGLKNKEIAYAMTLSAGTIKDCVTRLYRKVRVHDRFELALFALNNFLAGPARELDPPGVTGESRPPARSLPSFSFAKWVNVECPARPASIGERIHDG